MKRLLIVVFISMLFLTGCGKVNHKDVFETVKKQLDKSSGYQIKGELEILNNDDTYTYDIVVDHQKENYFKVSLVNQANQFQQIIVKNKDGVFLLNPSLNKSFKFQSDWPYVNSEIYLLDALVKDIENDLKHTLESKDNYYVFDTKVDYPNNQKLDHQRIIFDSNYHLKEVKVYDKNDVVCMSFTVQSFKYSPKYQDDYFDVESMIDLEEEKEETVKETSVIEDVLYPLLLPSGTKLVGEEKITKDSGERVIMTYDGEKSFVLVEETLDVFQEFTIIPTSGEPFQLMDTIGVMTDNSLSWSSGNMEYYLVSDVMSMAEMVDVAQSIVGVPSFK